jgi:integrase
MALTDAAVRKAKAADKPRRLFDAGGLYLEVSPAGGKWWRFKYRFNDREKRLSLGVYPDVGLADARAGRDEARKLLARGVDPSVQRKATRAARRDGAANCFEVVAREWLAVKKSEWTERQFEKERDRLQNHAFPWIGKLPIRDIGVAEIRPLLERIARRGHLEQAHRLRFQLSRIFRYAVAAEYTDRDPAADLSATLPARRKRNYPTITDPDKVGGLLRAIDSFDGTFVVDCALKLAPLLFVRPGELRGAEWAEFEIDHPDGSRWSIPPSRRKLRKAEKEDPKTEPHIVPLSTQAIAVLEELRPVTGSGRYVFPGARTRTRPISDMTINAALRRMGYDRDTMTGHGFRHMASTLLNELGFKPEAIERQLSHKEPGVRGVYNKAEYLPERIGMMQAWADYLDALREGKSKLVSIRPNIRRKTTPKVTLQRKAG